LPFSIDFDRRPYNTLALPCECVIHGLELATDNLTTKFEVYICTGDEDKNGEPKSKKWGGLAFGAT